MLKVTLKKSKKQKENSHSLGDLFLNGLISAYKGPLILSVTIFCPICKSSQTGIMEYTSSTQFISCKKCQEKWPISFFGNTMTEFYSTIKENITLEPPAQILRITLEPQVLRGDRSKNRSKIRGEFLSNIKSSVIKK